MTPKQLNFVNKLISREGLSFASDDFALEFSKNRTADLGDLTHQETQALIGYFQTPSPQQKMKRKILSMAHEMRWETKEGKVDMVRLNDWCNKSTASHCDSLHWFRRST